MDLRVRYFPVHHTVADLELWVFSVFWVNEMNSGLVAAGAQCTLSVLSPWIWLWATFREILFLVTFTIQFLWSL